MPRSQRSIKAPQFSSGSEDDARRQLRRYNLDTSFLFSYENGKPFVCKAESKSWPMGLHLDDKLSLKERETIEIFIGSVSTDAVFIRKGPSKLIAKLKREMQDLYNKRNGLSTQTIDEELDEGIRSPVEDGGSQLSQSNVGSAETDRQNSQVLNADREDEHSPNTPVLFKQPVVMPEQVHSMSGNCDGVEFFRFLEGHEKRITKAKGAFLLLKKKGDKKRRKICTEYDEHAEELEEILELHAHGFQSVDMHADLLEKHPVTSVMHLGVDLMNKLKANAYPSQLGRELRRQLFGDDGLVNDMIDAEFSTQKVDADPMLVRKFFDVVHQKYPITPRMAYRKARDSANQAGRERKAYLRRAVTTVGEI